MKVYLMREKISQKEDLVMTNKKFLKSLKKTKEFSRYICYLGEHGHGHYHSERGGTPGLGY